MRFVKAGAGLLHPRLHVPAIYARRTSFPRIPETLNGPGFFRVNSFGRSAVQRALYARMLERGTFFWGRVVCPVPSNRG